MEHSKSLREIPTTAQPHSRHWAFMVPFPQSVWAMGSALSFSLLSSVLGEMNRRLGAEQKADHGSIRGQISLVWVMAANGKGRSGEYRGSPPSRMGRR